MHTALQTLVAGVVDYAGLFPPAKLDMAPAVAAYAEYLGDPARAMLGRFIVPVARLDEFEAVARGLLPRAGGAEPWRLSVLTGPDVAADLRQIDKFNERHADGSDAGRAVVDSIEIKAATTAEIGAAMSIMHSGLRAFFELPLDHDPDPLIAELRRSGGAAKIRTGGVTADAFPPVDQVARFIDRCYRHRVAFKATAGLHHPVRARYRLTYDDDPPYGTMYGYLNVFAAAALAWTGAAPSLVRAALEETDPAQFTTTDAALAFRGHVIPTETLGVIRRTFALSFGSCSFREPVDELAALEPTS